MCGIAGIILDSKDRNLESLMEPLAEGIRYRGPDGVHSYQDPAGKFLFVHSLLKIMDKSDKSIQPISDEMGNVMILNGSIYNFEKLKKTYSLDPSYNDTQCLFSLLKTKGEKILPELEGMFAMAYYDVQNKYFLLARDRFGEKPLFYTSHEGALLFASSRRSLWNAGVPRVVDKNTALDFLCYNKLGVLQDLYVGIQQLRAGHYVKQNSFTHFEQIPIERISISEQGFDEVMRDSLEDAYQSDYPVAHSLSGGIDSGGLLSYSLEQGAPSVFSFRSIGYERDESEKVKTIEKYLNLDKVEWVQFPDDSLEILEDWKRISAIQEEPLASPSSMAQYYLYRKISHQSYRVLLEGQGSDEIFCGYPKYFMGLLFDHQISNSYIHSKSSPSEKKNWYKYLLYKFSPSAYRKLYRKKGKKIAQKYCIKSEFWNQYKAQINDEGIVAASGGVRKQMDWDSYQDLFVYILRTADRTSMYHNLELRLPYLHSGILSLASQLDDNELWRDGYFKYFLRNALKGKLPESILWEKNKNGFEAPLEVFIKEPGFSVLFAEASNYFFELGWTESKELKLDLENSDDQMMAWKFVSLYLALSS